MLTPSPPGSHQVVGGIFRQPGARAPGHVARTYPIELVADVTTPLSLTLERVAPTTVAPDLATPGWISIAAGVALVGAGTGFLLWADSTRDDMRGLTRDNAIRILGYPAYAGRYDELEADFEGQRLASQVFRAEISFRYLPPEAALAGHFAASRAAAGSR